MITNMNHIVGSMDIILITFDTLRYDAAQSAFLTGKLPNLAKVLPDRGWEKRFTSGTFTYPAHSAFFAGFLPVPCDGKKHDRLFASDFTGSETTGIGTFVFREPNLVEALKNKGYETVCIGGVGFFNKQNELGRIFPEMFDQSYWDTSIGVTNPESVREQFTLAKSVLTKTPQNKHLFLFINISAIHQPNYFYIENRKKEEGDNLESHKAALEYVDSQMPMLLELFDKRRQSFHIYCSDHGTCYGEDGFFGHNIAHEKVLEVPYTQFIYPANGNN